MQVFVKIPAISTSSTAPTTDPFPSSECSLNANKSNQSFADLTQTTVVSIAPKADPVGIRLPPPPGFIPPKIKPTVAPPIVNLTNQTLVTFSTGTVVTIAETSMSPTSLPLELTSPKINDQPLFSTSFDQNSTIYSSPLDSGISALDSPRLLLAHPPKSKKNNPFQILKERSGMMTSQLSSTSGGQRVRFADVERRSETSSLQPKRINPSLPNLSILKKTKSNTLCSKANLSQSYFERPSSDSETSGSEEDFDMNASYISLNPFAPDFMNPYTAPGGIAEANTSKPKNPFIDVAKPKRPNPQTVVKLGEDFFASLCAVPTDKNMSSHSGPKDGQLNTNPVTNPRLSDIHHQPATTTPNPTSNTASAAAASGGGGKSKPDAGGDRYAALKDLDEIFKTTVNMSEPAASMLNSIHISTRKNLRFN